MSASLAVPRVFINAIVTGVQTACPLLKLRSPFGCLYCLTTFFSSPASVSCPDCGLHITRNNLWWLVFYWLPCLITGTVAVLTHTIYRALAIDFAVDDSIDNIFRRLTFSSLPGSVRCSPSYVCTESFCAAGDMLSTFFAMIVRFSITDSSV